MFAYLTKKGDWSSTHELMEQMFSHETDMEFMQEEGHSMGQVDSHCYAKKATILGS